jgi:hypothetical protein
MPFCPWKFTVRGGLPTNALIVPLKLTKYGELKLPEIESIEPFSNTTAVTLYFPDFNDLHFKNVLVKKIVPYEYNYKIDELNYTLTKIKKYNSNQEENIAKILKDPKKSQIINNKFFSKNIPK